MRQPHRSRWHGEFVCTPDPPLTLRSIGTRSSTADPRSGGPGRRGAIRSERSKSFATGAAVRVSTLQLRSTLATIAESQLERWHAGATVLVEGDAWAKSILRNDYWTGIGIPNPGAHFGQASWWSAVAWSAAFIMACARKTQAALQLPNPVLGHRH